MKTKILSIMNFKGGCAKTTTTVGLGSALVRQGFKVLLVDFDPQGHVGMHLGINNWSEEGVWIEDVILERDKSMMSCIRTTDMDNLYVAPSGRGLLHAREKLERRIRRETVLKTALNPLRGGFDYILIDTPPDEGVLSVNAMYAGPDVIVPTTLDTLSLTGINPLMDMVEMMNEAYPDRGFRIMGVLISRYDKRTNIANKANELDLKVALEDVVFENRIRIDENVKKAQMEGKTIHEWNPHTRSAVDFDEFAAEVMFRTL